MDDEQQRPHRARRGGGGCGTGCGTGCGGFIVVLTLGILLSLFSVDIGIGVSLRVPFTPANVTAAGALGAKEDAAHALPDYARGRLGGNQDIVNYSQTLTLGPAEGASLFLIGQQKGAPVIDLHLALHHR